MSSPRNWKICDFNPAADIFTCKGPLDRTIQSYSEIVVDSIVKVFDHLYIRSPANNCTIDPIIHANIEQKDNGEDSYVVYYKVTIDFPDIISADVLTKDRQAWIDVIEKWCEKCDVKNLRGYRAYAIKRPKFSTKSGYRSGVLSYYASIDFEVVFVNCVWYSGRRITTGCIAGVAQEDFEVLASLVEDNVDCEFEVSFVKV